jgi:RNA ligase
LPEEFHPWVRKAARDLFQAYADIDMTVQKEYDAILYRLNIDWMPPVPRREFAALATRATYPGLLFLKLDGKDLSEKIWKMIRPEHTHPNFAQTEDTA